MFFCSVVSTSLCLPLLGRNPPSSPSGLRIVIWSSLEKKSRLRPQILWVVLGAGFQSHKGNSLITKWCLRLRPLIRKPKAKKDATTEGSWECLQYANDKCFWPCRTTSSWNPWSECAGSPSQHLSKFIFQNTVGAVYKRLWCSHFQVAIFMSRWRFRGSICKPALRNAGRAVTCLGANTWKQNRCERTVVLGD